MRLQSAACTRPPAAVVNPQDPTIGSEVVRRVTVSDTFDFEKATNQRASQRSGHIIIDINRKMNSLTILASSLFQLYSSNWVFFFFQGLVTSTHSTMPSARGGPKGRVARWSSRSCNLEEPMRLHDPVWPPVSPPLKGVAPYRHLRLQHQPRLMVAEDKGHGAPREGQESGASLPLA